VPEDGGGGGKQEGGGGKLESSIPSDRELLEAMDPQAMWKDVQKHAGIGAHTQLTSHLSWFDERFVCGYLSEGVFA